MATQVSRAISVASLGSPEKIGGSTILQTDGVKKNEVPFEIAESDRPGGIRLVL